MPIMSCNFPYASGQKGISAERTGVVFCNAPCVCRGFLHGFYLKNHSVCTVSEVHVAFVMMPFCLVVPTTSGRTMCWIVS